MNVSQANPDNVTNCPPFHLVDPDVDFQAVPQPVMFQLEVRWDRVGIQSLDRLSSLVVLCDNLGLIQAVIVINKDAVCQQLVDNPLQVVLFVVINRHHRRDSVIPTKQAVRLVGNYWPRLCGPATAHPFTIAIKLLSRDFRKIKSNWEVFPRK